MTTPLISDAELLAMGIASDALAQIPSGVRDTARATATALAISYLRKRFMPPYSSVSDDVKRAIAHIATFDLLARRGYSAQLGADGTILARYDSAIQWLRDAARGIVEPESIVDSTPTVEEASPLISTSGSAPLWGSYGKGGTGSGCCS